MNNLIIGICTYNEEHRFLEECLKNMKELSDKIVIIDDGSTDNSYNIDAKYATKLLQTDHLYNKNESTLRKILWNECCKIAEDGDYIFINDADEIFTKNSTTHFYEEFNKAAKAGSDGIGFLRYEMWNKDKYRKDDLWWSDTQCVRCVKYRKNYVYYWKGWKIHGGSIPINSYFTFYPSKLQIQHWAYSTPELRAEKIKFYNQYDPKDEYEIPNKYKSILDENPNLIEFKDNFEDAK